MLCLPTHIFASSNQQDPTDFSENIENKKYYIFYKLSEKNLCFLYRTFKEIPRGCYFTPGPNITYYI